MVDLLSVTGLFGLGFLVASLLMTVALTWLGLKDRGPSPIEAEPDDETAASS